VKRLLIGIAGAIALTAIAACGAPKAPTSPSGVVVTGDVIRGTGTVRFMTLEGGFFAIHGDDGIVYDPMNLPAAFRRDGTRVRFEARIRRDLGGIHMVGPIVEVLSITAN
jgi:hypothetical protein